MSPIQQFEDKLMKRINAEKDQNEKTLNELMQILKFGIMLLAGLIFMIVWMRVLYVK